MAARKRPARGLAPLAAAPLLPGAPAASAREQPQETAACQAAASAMLAMKTPKANQPSTWQSSATSARLPVHVQQRRPSHAQQEPHTSGSCGAQGAA